MRDKKSATEGQRRVRGGKDGRQVIATVGHRWTDADEVTFLDSLAATCNVTLSAATVGFSTEAIYARRRRDPVFAERWEAALAQGYARIEMAMVGRVADTLEGLVLDAESPLPPLTVRDTVAVLSLNRAAVKGEGRAPGWRARPRSLDEMRGSILTKLEAIEAVRTAAAGTEAAPDEA